MFDAAVVNSMTTRWLKVCLMRSDSESGVSQTAEDIRQAIQSRMADGESLSAIARQAGVPLGSLKQFMYRKSDAPRFGLTYLRLRSLIMSLDPSSQIRSVRLSERDVSPKRIAGDYFFYRRSIYKDNIVKMDLSIYANEIGEYEFRQLIKGITANRIVIGYLNKYISNIALKGVAYNKQAESDNADLSSPIGEETVVFHMDYLQSDHMHCNFLSISGTLRSICGSGLMIRAGLVKDGIDIGNHPTETVKDRIGEKCIADLIKENYEDGRIFTVTN